VVLAGAPNAAEAGSGQFVGARDRSSSARIGPSAVWKRADSGTCDGSTYGCVVPAVTSCGSNGFATAAFKRCIEAFMRKHGASETAVGFFAATESYLVALIPTGQVDVGFTLPVSGAANLGVGLLFLNGSKQYLSPVPPPLSSARFSRLRHAYRLPSGATALTIGSQVFFESSGHVRSNLQEIVLQYQLENACSACAVPFHARVAYLFSESGRLTGTVTLGPCSAPFAPAVTAASTPVPVREPACPHTHAVA
jgi:hypothetical protein